MKRKDKKMAEQENGVAKEPAEKKHGIKSILHFMKRHKVGTVFTCLFLIAVIVGIAVFPKIVRKPTMDNEASMQTATLSRRTIMNTLSVTGTIASTSSKTVTSSLTDVEVKSLNVQVGDYVQAGDIICVFESSDLEEELADAKINLNVSQLKTANEIEAAQEALENSKTSAEVSTTRATENVSEAAASYEAAQSAESQAKAAYEKAQEKVSELKAKIEDYSEQTKAANTKLSSLQDELAKAETEEEKANIQAQIKTVQEEISDIAKNSSTATSNYEAAKKTAEEKLSSYEAAGKETETAKSSYKKATQESEDAVRSGNESVSSKEDSLENSKLNAVNASSNEEEQVENLTKQIESCTIEAPIDGVITSLGVESGETFSGGDVVTVQDNQSFLVEVTVDEYDIADIEKGMRVVVKTDATGDEELDGEVIFVAPTPTSTESSMGSSESQSGYLVKIQLNTTNERLRIGMTAKASIVLEESADVFAVPYDAISTNEAGESVIYVLASQGENSKADREERTENSVSENAAQESGFGTGIGKGDGEENRREEKSENTTEFQPEQKGGMKTESTEASQQSLKTREIVVTVGLESDYYTEISSDELVEGMEVLLSTQTVSSDAKSESSQDNSGSMLGGMGGGRNGGFSQDSSPGGGNPGGGGHGGF